MNESRISVVVPTHLREGLLARALASVLQQTRRPDEVLVIDDVGSESTAALVSRVALHNDKPVRHLVRDGRPGAAASRQFGAEQASFDVVVYLDDDDLWFPWHLRELAAAMESTGCDAAAAPRIEFSYPSAKVTAVLRPALPRSSFEMFAGGTGVGGSNLAINGDVIREFAWDSGLTTWEDGDLVIRLLLAGCHVCVSRLPSVAVRHHDGPRLRNEDQAGWDRVLDKHRAAVPVSAVVLQAIREQPQHHSDPRSHVVARWSQTLQASLRDSHTTPWEVAAVFARYGRIRTAGLGAALRYRRWQRHLVRLLERTEHFVGGVSSSNWGQCLPNEGA